jgi:two-component system response regulator AtoC
MLLAHSWPGNIRELDNVIRKFIILRDPELIGRDLRQRRGSASPATPAALPLPAPAAVQNTPILEQVTKAKQQAETEAILAALNSTHWNRKQAAALLKIDYKALLYKMKKLGIEDKLVAFPAAGLKAEDALAREMTATGA